MVYSKDIKYMHKEEMKNKSGKFIAPLKKKKAHKSRVRVY